MTTLAPAPVKLKVDLKAELAAIPPERYNFDRDFQRQILAVALQKPEFLLGFRDVFEPEYFEDTQHEVIAIGALEHFDAFGRPPEFSSLREILRKSEMLKPGEFTQVSSEALALYRLNVVDIGLVKQLAIEFGCHQAIRRAILASSSDLAPGMGKVDFDKIQARIDAARRVGQDRMDMGRLYLKQRNDRKGSTALQKLGRPCTTGWPGFDRLLAGGLYPTQMGVVLAPPKRGKTSVCVNIAAANVMMGRRVHYYTCEVSAEIIEERLDQRLCGLTREEVQKQWSRVVETKLAMLEAKGGEVVVKFYPMRTATVRTVRDHLRRVSDERGAQADLVIVDYGALLKPSRTYKDSSYQTVGGIYEDLKSLAQDGKVPLWTPQQANRGSLRKAKVTEEDQADTFVPAQVCDAQFALCMTDEDMLQKQMRLLLTLNRNGPGGVGIKVSRDMKTQTLIETGAISEEEDRVHREHDKKVAAKKR